MNPGGRRPPSLLAAVCLLPAVLAGRPARADGDEPAAAAPLVYVVPVQGNIDVGTFYMVDSTLDEAEKEHATCVILEINSSGGDLSYINMICQRVSDAKVPTVAHVQRGSEGGAQGGAALVALACQKIFIDELASIGSNGPMEWGSVDSTERVRKWMRERVRKLIQAAGRTFPPVLAEAMVHPEAAVWEVNREDKRAFLSPDEIQRLRKTGEKIEEVKLWNEAGHTLILSATDAVALGVANGLARDQGGVLAALGQPGAGVRTTEPGFRVGAVRFLTNGFVTALLVMIGLIGLGVEIKSPGLVIPGTVALLAFSMVFVGHSWAGLASTTEIGLFIIGVILLIVEIYVLPGFGVVGIAGIILVVAALVLSMQSFVWPSAEQEPWQGDQMKYNFLVILTSFAAGIIGLAMIARLLPKTPGLNRLVLQAEITHQVGGPMPESQSLTEMIGKPGVALTPLRPSGKVDVGGRHLDVVAEGDFIDSGEPVRILEIEGNRIVVGRIDRQATA